MNNASRSGLSPATSAYESLLLQQRERPAAVGGIVGNGDLRAVGQRGEAAQFLRVGAEWLDVNLAVWHRDELRAGSLVEGVEIGLMLKEIGVQLVFGDLQIGLHVIGEDPDVQHHARGG